MRMYITITLAGALLVANSALGHVDATQDIVTDDQAMSLQEMQARISELWSKSRTAPSQCERTRSALKANALEAEVIERESYLTQLVDGLPTEGAALRVFAEFRMRNFTQDGPTDLDIIAHMNRCDISIELMPDFSPGS